MVELSDDIICVSVVHGDREETRQEPQITDIQKKITLRDAIQTKKIYEELEELKNLKNLYIQ